MLKQFMAGDFQCCIAVNVSLGNISVLTFPSKFLKFFIITLILIIALLPIIIIIMVPPFYIYSESLHLNRS